MKIAISGTNKKVLFHIFLWSIWLYLPLSNVNDDEFYSRAVLISLLIIFTHIPLFVLNTEWLIPKILMPKGILLYILSLILTVALFYLFHNFIFDWYNHILDKNHLLRSFKFSKGLLALTIVALISTGYALLNYVVTQEKIQQEKQSENLLSELSFLRSQISPHFIFNVLNGIVYLIRSKSDLAEPVTLKLSELMRYMLYETGNAQIPLEKELNYLKNYVELQKVRFEEDVEIRLNTEGVADFGLEMSDVGTTNNILNQQSKIGKIEPMLLIPFVENAFKHGVGTVLNPIIDIDLKVVGNTLSFSVKNKMATDNEATKDASSGIGLKNVQRRLELLYPNAHQLTIEKDDNWFKVRLILTF